MVAIGKPVQNPAYRPSANYMVSFGSEWANLWFFAQNRRIQQIFDPIGKLISTNARKP